MLLGDFNINLLSSSPTAQNITSTLSTFHLSQIVIEPTRISSSSSSLIDHVYISDPSLANSCQILTALGSSDHSCISLLLTRDTIPPHKHCRRMWSYRAADWDRANDLLTQSLSIDLSEKPDIDSTWTSWKAQFMTVMRSCIPSRIIKIKKSLPWLNAEIIRTMKKRDYFHRLAKSTDSHSIHRKYCALRNLSVTMVRKAKYTFINLMSASIRSPKQFWSMYHSLTPNRERIPHTLSNGTISVESPTSKANLLNSFFSSCFSAAPCDESLPITSPPSSIHPELSNIQCTDDEVDGLLCSLKTKTSSGPDGISSHMLRNTAYSISSTLCKLFNYSLSTGCYPAEWKCSNVTPVFKSGNKSMVSNYRPISLLSIPSKILERIVHRKLLHHLISNSILSPRQFGFRPGSSTQEAILTATHDWQSCLDRGLSSAALFLDMSKAFDKVPHHKLLLSLAAVGVSGPLLQWFKSYLSNRTQTVVLSGHSSSSIPVKSGVPQGSILGPLLFIIYANSLAQLNLSPESSIILYADDILLYRAVSSSHDGVLLQQDVDAISAWIKASGLAINPSKSTLLVISRKRVKPNISLLINSTPIPCADSVKYLGVTITSDLKWNAHVCNTCKSAKLKLGLLYRNFHQADQRTLSHLYKTLVIPKLDYYSSVWDPYNASLTNSLESVQSFAAKLCTKRWSASSHELTQSLNWPPLHTRRSRQKTQLCRRIIKNESIIPPSSYYHPVTHSNPRIHHSFSVTVPFARTTSFQCSFFVSSCVLWNSLPNDLVTLTTARAFKAALLHLPPS